METLPDYLRAGLDLVFVGINPGAYSAQVGHYFANTRNRFWMAFNAAGMTPLPLTPEADYTCLLHGIGFTDVVKRPTPGMADLKLSEFALGALVLQEKLLQYQPLVVCFNGVSGFRNYMKRVSPEVTEGAPGFQQVTIGRSRVWVLPSTSPANAGVSLDRIVAGMRELKEFIELLKR